MGEGGKRGQREGKRARERERYIFINSIIHCLNFNYRDLVQILNTNYL